MNINNLYYTIFGGRLTGNVSGNGQITLKELREKIPMKSKEDYFSRFDTMRPEAELQAPQIDYKLTPQSFEKVLKKYITDAFEESGVEAQFDTLEVSTTADGQLAISGLKNDSDNMRPATALNRIISNKCLLSTKKDLGGNSRAAAHMQLMFYRNSDWAKSAETESEKTSRAALIRTKSTATQTVKDFTGVDLDFSKLYRKEDGSIGGYPEELAWHFEASILPVLPLTKLEGEALTIRRLADMFLEVGYDNIPNLGDLDFSVKFDKSDFI